MPPLVTVITVVFNAKKELEEILSSIFDHDTENFEFIVIDGNSGDGTVELLREWDDKIDFWMSEQDAGIYDAMNKGLDLATGHFVYHLNAGDTLLHLPMLELTAARAEKIDVASFPVSVDGTRQFVPSCGPLLRFKNTLHHQGTFYRRDIFPKYDLQYRVLADFDTNQRLALQRVRMKAYTPVVALHASGGVGDSAKGYVERFQIVRKNFGAVYVAGSWLLSEWGGIKARNLYRLKRLFGISRAKG